MDVAINWIRTLPYNIPPNVLLWRTGGSISSILKKKKKKQNQSGNIKYLLTLMWWYACCKDKEVSLVCSFFFPLNMWNTSFAKDTGNKNMYFTKSKAYLVFVCWVKHVLSQEICSVFYTRNLGNKEENTFCGFP